MGTMQGVCQVEKLNICSSKQGAIKRCIWWYHIIAEFWQSPFELLAEVRTVENALKDAINTNGMKNDITSISYQFQPFGVSAQVAAGGSYIYIHTWPERGYSAIDILAETKEEAYKILEKLQQNLQPKNVYIAEIVRGLPQTEGGET